MVGDFFRRLPEAEYLPPGMRYGPIPPRRPLSRRSIRTRPYARTRRRRPAKPQVHAGTPTVAHADSLGRTFLTVAHNKFKYSDTPPADPPTEEFHRTRVLFDIEGNQREVIDAKDRIVMRYDYDMLGNPHPPGQHGGWRALDAERCGGQTALRLGQPQSPVPHRLRSPAAADGLLPA